MNVYSFEKKLIFIVKEESNLFWKDCIFETNFHQSYPFAEYPLYECDIYSHKIIIWPGWPGEETGVTVGQGVHLMRTSWQDL
jgi:hypothetical protein